MDHTAPCDKLVDTLEKVAGMKQASESDHSWIEDIHRDLECTKKELMILKIRMAVLVTAATLAGNLLYGLIDKLWPSLRAAINIIPGVYAGN